MTLVGIVHYILSSHSNHTMCTHLVVVLDGLPEPVVLVVGGEDLGEEAEEGGVGDGRLLAEQERLVAQVLGKGLIMREEGERGFRF